MEGFYITICVKAAFSGDIEARRSSTGFIIDITATPIYWHSKRQTVIPLSWGEADYVALFSCAKEIMCIRQLLWEMVHGYLWDSIDVINHPTPIFSDSTVLSSLEKKRQESARAKHIDLKVHHICEFVSNGII